MRTNLCGCPKYNCKENTQGLLLAAYVSGADIEAGELGGRSGSIQAAVNLEIPQDTISKINVKLEGLNGQLPNLDLVNTVVRLCKRERIVPTLHKRVGPSTLFILGFLTGSLLK